MGNKIGSGYVLHPKEPIVNYNPYTSLSFENLVNDEQTDEINNGEEPNGTTLSFHNLNYTIDMISNAWHKLPFCSAANRKQILFEVSGIFQQGMNAILGPTGCGKSTLLDILADRKDRQNCEGQVLINGYERPPPSIFRPMVGYVVQDDIISGTLTVRENIAFSANLRLHPSVTSKKRLARVEEVIKQLGLSECANTRMGSELKRGVSGGERKRTCIAMELVLSPKILFLDEPTTGLDASTACDVMICLRDLSRKGCTIVFSIHQPRHSIFELFDTVLLLSHGHNVYFGSPAEVRPYFIAKNFVCQQSENPADFALDVLITAARNNRTSELCQMYRDSNMHIENAEYLSNILDNSRIAIKNQQKPARSIKSEFFYVSQRTLRTAIRNSALLTWQLVVAIILALLTGLLYYRLPQTIGSGVQNRLGGIFFVVVNQIFSTATALEPFIKERALFIHENVSGYYSMSTLFLVKLVCDLLPMRVIPSIIFSIICYMMMGLQNDIGKFFVFFVTIFMANVFGSATCFFVAASISVFDGQASDFYWACQADEVDLVRRILLAIPFQEITRLQLNRSTALHAASYFGHKEIVNLLLNERGVIRHKQNRHGLTAYEEAANDEIRQVFHRMNINCFCTNNVDNDDDDTDLSGQVSEVERSRFGNWIHKDEADNVEMKQTMYHMDIHAASVSGFRYELKPIRPDVTVMNVSTVNATVNTLQKLLAEHASEHAQYEKACEVVRIYKRTDKIEPLLHLCTLETPFYKILGKDKLPCISEYEDERDVLVFVNTMFRVTNIESDVSPGLHIIYLENLRYNWNGNILEAFRHGVLGKH
ncbi:unnamed protein product [Rotaria magnacalcarata]